jgi:ubiquinone/menaquinone biosynthesis C-methylase UbiE
MREEIKLEKAVKSMYERLAALLTVKLDLKRASIILEAGAGRGQLTIPLVKILKKAKNGFKMIALDNSTGPYAGNLETLKRKVRKERLEDFVEAVNGDVRNMKMIGTESVDLIISNETLCELNRAGLESAIQEFHRILKPNGEMAHSELIPVAENEAQRLVIDANAHSMETSLPKPEWLSPFSDEVAAVLHKTGFKNIKTDYFETNVKMDYVTALSKLKEWRVDPRWVKENLSKIRRFGLELPMEHIVFCKKCDTDANMPACPTSSVSSTLTFEQR